MNSANQIAGAAAVGVVNVNVDGGRIGVREAKRKRVAQMLAQPLHGDSVKFRQISRGQTAGYVETHHVFELANTIFGFTGWSSEITAHDMDFMEQTENSRFSCGYWATVRVTALDGNVSHEDVGYGETSNQPTDAMAFEMASKTAISDAYKRACRLFGSALGNSLYDKLYVEGVRRGLYRDRPPITAVDREPLLNDVKDEAAFDAAIIASEQPTPGSLSARIGSLRT